MNIAQEHALSYPRTSALFEWLFSFFSTWFVAGIFVDGWAHNHLVSSLETFFTPWHGIFYSGFTALAFLLFTYSILNRKKGYPFFHSVPKEYILSLAGVCIFFIGGIGDMVWHILFGIEASVEALLSPTHLLLAVGGILTVAGPLRRVWQRGAVSADSWDSLPFLVSFTCVLSLLTFMIQYTHPFTHPWMGLLQKPLAKNVFDAQALGIANVLIPTTIFTGLVLMVMPQFTFPVGSFSFILMLNGYGMSAMHDEYRFVMTALLAGFMIDILYFVVNQSVTDAQKRIRLFLFLSPCILYGSYVLTILYTEGTWWSVHLWAGSIVIAGIVGWLMSYVRILPAGEA